LADITVIAAYSDEKKLMVVLVYIPNLCSRKMKEENLEELSSKLEMIKRLAQDELIRNPHMEIVITIDFNRHNQLWGGSRINNIVKQEESLLIINFMAELSLQSLLSAGAITFVSNIGCVSTIDLMFTTPGLANEMAKCFI
jgi:hypothetical protein